MFIVTHTIHGKLLQTDNLKMLIGRVTTAPYPHPHVGKLMADLEKQKRFVYAQQTIVITIE